MTIPTTPPRWGWTRPAQCLLATLAALLGLCLVALASSSRGVPPPLPALILDINTAPPQVLSVLPGLGPTLLGRIVAARGERPFRSLDDLDRRVKGVGPKTVAAWTPFLRVELSTPSTDRPAPLGTVDPAPLDR